MARVKGSLKLTYMLETYHSWLTYTPGSADPVCLVYGDETTATHPACIRKARSSSDDGGGVLYKMNYGRHWGHISKTLEEDTPWEEKRDVAIWRGATTGHPWPYGGAQDYNPGDPAMCDRAHLVMRIDEFRSNPRIDVGVTKYVQRVPSFSPVKSSVPRKEMLRSKMLVMVEGNDAATGLKWALLSDSAVVMPRPKVSTWLMESLLVPGVHYVEVRGDFGDLEEKVEWCLRNDEECRRIGESELGSDRSRTRMKANKSRRRRVSNAAFDLVAGSNGKCWMERFLDGAEEGRVMEAVWRGAGDRMSKEKTCAAF